MGRNASTRGGVARRGGHPRVPRGRRPGRRAGPARRDRAGPRPGGGGHRVRRGERLGTAAPGDAPRRTRPPRRGGRCASGLWHAGVTADVVPPGAPLDGCRLLVLPALYLASDATVDWVRRHVHDGGHLLVTWLSGVADEHARVRLGGYPGAYRDLLGVRVEEFHPLADDEHVPLTGGGTGRIWSETVHPAGAETVSAYAGEHWTGGPRSPGTGSATRTPGTSPPAPTTTPTGDCSPRRQGSPA
ncbi:beta-galactosidase trimerization domain-containing protein [Micromonospora sp. BRA006-A]|nr:beta-galactosidase trimerization domain-containing protein [Micromonospora sp. BRA006-A]